MQGKLLFLFALVLLLLAYLNLYIAWINIKNGDKYTRQVLSQQTYDSRSIPYRRGEIRDRNGNVLAQSEKVYTAILDCSVVLSDKSYIEPTIRAAVQYLGVKEGKIRSILNDDDNAENMYYPIQWEITKEEKQAFDDYRDITKSGLTESQAKERASVRGIWFEETYLRKYPMKNLACSVIGFANENDEGILGLEAYYSDVLNGVNGREYGYLDSESQLQENVIEPENGNSIVSTIDVNIQQVCEKYIAELEEENKDGPQEKTKGRASLNTGVIVANPNNGEILAMATDRVFDLNEPYDLSGWYSKRQQERMTPEEKTEALTNLWYNFCVSEAFELGSTYKPNVVAAAIDSGSIKEDFGVHCVGNLQPVSEEDPIACTGIHGDETLKDIIANSCNPGMMTIGMRMGVDTFVKYQGVFGFGKRTGIDLPNENSGSLYDENTMAIMELCTCSFGQGFTATMLQELQAFCADVNGGYLYKPHIVKQILTPEGEIAKNVEPLLISQPISAHTSALVREYLEAVVTDGTATEAQIPGYSIGGKTGTAEKLPRGNEKYIISYICAVPIDDPKVVIYTVIDEPNIENQEAGIFTKLLAKNILQEILPYMGVYPTEEITDAQREVLGIQVETEKPKTKTIVEYVYDWEGNLVYDEETWEPMTELIEVVETEPETESRGSLYGNVIPPDEREDDSVDENYAEKMNPKELRIGIP